MTYIYCRECDWQQDDFWGRHYNPITKIWSYLKSYARPRIIYFDFGDGLYAVFSWWFLTRKIWRELVKNIPNQKWWTYAAFTNDKRRRCPNCGALNRFGID